MPDMVRKICLCGDPSVGKTSLVRRFVVGKYDEKYISTLGTVISKKTISLPHGEGNVTLLIWDISGQSEFKRIHASAFSNAAGGFVVCDATRQDTIEHAKEWIATFRKSAGKDVLIIVLANKIDLFGDDGGARAVEKLIGGIGGRAYLTSAKTGAGVEEAFKELALRIAESAPISSVPEALPVLANGGNGMPENFNTPTELLDYMAISFCNTLADHEIGMHMLRKQVTDQGINFHNLNKKDAENLAERLEGLVKNFKGAQDATKMKLNMVKAIDRTKW